jgi:pimeloyl-ACP methyl ester carboxylesterase
LQQSSCSRAKQPEKRLPAVRLTDRNRHTEGVRATGRKSVVAIAAACLGLTACTSSGSKHSAPSPTLRAASTAPASTAASRQPAQTSASIPPLTSPSSPTGLGSGAKSAAPTPEQLPHIDDSTLQRFYTQKLAWKSCAGGFQCADLTVPLDYSQPAGPTIKLSVVRERTTARNRIGSVVLNPGGPGGSGVQYAEAAAPLIGEQLGGRFDVVSFDPRGVGQSAPIRCLSSKQLDTWIGYEASPDDPTQVAKQDELAKQFAAGCAANAGALLAHVSTVDTARDLDVLRAALADPKLTYIGASYGTFLGAIYAQLFPANVRALVLDGALDPSSSAAELNQVQAHGFEVALASYIATCVKSSSCPLGSSPTAAEPKLDGWLAKLVAKPLTLRGRVLTYSLAVQGVAAALYSPTSWPDLSDALTAAFKDDPSGLLALSDEIDGRQPDGSYDNLVESNSAINCVDRPGLGPTIADYARAAAAGAADGPTFGVLLDWGNVVCADWPVPPELSPGPVNPAGAPPILVVGTLRDPATPYRWAQALAKQLNGPLLTFDGDGHTAFLRSACVDAAVKSYLVSLTTPPAGEVCQ